MVEQCYYQNVQYAVVKNKDSLKINSINQSTNIRQYFVLNCTYKMNEIVNKFLLAGDEFMLEMHLKQPGFTYGPCGPFTKNKQKIRKFKETGATFTKMNLIKHAFNMI